MSEQASVRKKRLEWLGLALILLVALAIRLYALGSFPDTFNPDEADNAQDALRIIAGRPPDGGFFGLDWKPQPAYSVYQISLLLRLVSDTVLATRLPSALIGAFSVLPFFWLVRRQSPAFAALAATLLMATSLWHVHFSRSGWENIQIPGFALGALACVVWAIDTLRLPNNHRKAWILFIAAGVFCALGLYSYFSGRLIIVILLVAVLPLLINKRERSKELLIGVGLTTLTALLLFLPMLPIILSDWDFFNQRSATVLLLSQPEFRLAPLETMWSQVSKTIAMLWGGASTVNDRYAPVAEALLEPMTRVLVLAGMLLSLVLPIYRRYETWLWWMLLLIGWFVTQVLTTSTPDPARGTIMIPALFFFTALSMTWVAQFIGTLPNRVRIPIAVLGILLVGTTAVTNVSRYVEWQSSAEARDARQPYLRSDEIADWVVVVNDRAVHNQFMITVDDWQATHGNTVVAPTPISVEPVPAATQPEPSAPLNPGPTSAALVIDPPTTAAATWQQPIETLVMNRDRNVVPRAIAIDAANTIYMLDSTPEVQTISKMSSDGQVVLSWGGPGDRNDNGRFVEAWALAVDAQGHVLVLDAETGWVQVFDSNGTFLRKWGGPNLLLYKPRAMAIAADGTIYIADTGGRRVIAVSADGTLKSSFGDQRNGAIGDAALIEPSGIAIAQDNTLLVADASAGLIRHYAADGALLEVWAVGTETALDGPRLAVAKDGQVIITLPSRCELLQVNAQGQNARRIGNCDQRNFLDQPSAIAVAPDGTYLLSDLSQGKLVRFQP